MSLWEPAIANVQSDGPAVDVTDEQIRDRHVLSLFAPQPTTASHDAGCVDRSGARMPRFTDPGRKHAIGVFAQ
jgi:hypothetical protein